jgi:hypothetical protein
MSFKRFFLLALFVCLVLADKNDNKEKKDKNVEVKLQRTLECSKHVTEGECDKLKPKATGCMWTGEKHGWCIHETDGTVSNLFDL